MRRIVYTDDQSRTCIVLPCVNGDDPEGFTEADAEERAMKRLLEEQAAGAVVMVGEPFWIDEGSLPKDRTFRDAWVVTGGAIAEDFPKAKALARKRTTDPDTLAKIDAAQDLAALKAALAAQPATG